MDKLERKIMELEPETQLKFRALDLIALGYESFRDQLRKRVGSLEICYQRDEAHYYHFTAIIRREK